MATKPAQSCFAPTQPYVVVGSRYCVPYEKVLILKEERWSLHSEVFDTQGQRFFKTADQSLSLRDNKTIFDAQDNPICTLTSKIFSLRHTTYLCPRDSTDKSEALLTARCASFSLEQMLKVFLRGNMSHCPDIIVKGDYCNQNFIITTPSGSVLAEVHRDVWSARDDVDVRTCTVHIKPHVDMALVMALVAMAGKAFETKV